MSSIYIKEPATNGKVLLQTSAGDFDIELWSREAPKACRNFIQLCMENYYNGTIFHRVIKGFIAQGGDPTGTGNGGESIYGKPFRDEFHSRLRFVRRGLVGMANAGKHDNGSQFFFTLAACPELQDKHTIFGKIEGDTVYNLSHFEEGIIDNDDRPEYPHKIIKVEILKNPFDDIYPRIKIENEISNKKIKKKGTKNFKLLSFGEEAEQDEETFLTINKKLPKGSSAHDLAKDPKLSSEVQEEDITMLESIKEKFKQSTKSLEEKEEIPTVTEEELEKKNKQSEVRNEIRKLQKELKIKRPADEENIEDKKSPIVNPAIEIYENMNAKYKKAKENFPKTKGERETATLAMLAKFTSNMKEIQAADYNSDDDENNWLRHQLIFKDEGPVLAKDANLKDSNWHDIDDPRHSHNVQRRQEGSKRKKL